jgi:hypothetical protein
MVRVRKISQRFQRGRAQASMNQLRVVQPGDGKADRFLRKTAGEAPSGVSSPVKAAALA